MGGSQEHWEAMDRQKRLAEAQAASPQPPKMDVYFEREYKEAYRDQASQAISLLEHERKYSKILKDFIEKHVGPVERIDEGDEIHVFIEHDTIGGCYPDSDDSV